MKMRFLVLATVGLVFCACTTTVPDVSADTPAALAQRTSAGPEGSVLLPHTYLTTNHAQITDLDGHPVRLACIGYFAPGDIAHDVPGMAAAGFNCLRYPWFDATLPSQLAEMDEIVAAATRADLKVVLDHHGNEVPGPHNNYLPYPCNGLPIDLGPGTDGTDGCGDKGTVDLERFVTNWATLAQRYAGNTTVIGFDLTNEPHRAPSSWRQRGGGSTWADGSATDLKMMYEKAGSAIQKYNPGVLIICEGIGLYRDRLFDGTPLRTSGTADLSFVRQHPVSLPVPGHVVYSVHEYPATIGGVGPDSGPVKVRAMNESWGHLITQRIAPVWIGEMGGSMDGEGPDSAGVKSATERAWAHMMVAYLNGELGAQGGPVFDAGERGVSTTWWAWGYLSGQSPDGTLDKEGRLRPAQAAIYRKLQP